jgi:hypothetical protein
VVVYPVGRANTEALANLAQGWPVVVLCEEVGDEVHNLGLPVRQVGANAAVWANSHYRLASIARTQSATATNIRTMAATSSSMVDSLIGRVRVWLRRHLGVLALGKAARISTLSALQILAKQDT